MSEQPPRPDPLGVNPDAVPEVLTEREQWLCWEYSFDTDRDEWTKVPVDVNTGGYASSTDPETWTTFDAAVAYHQRRDRDTDGIGFVVHDGDTVLGLDLDDCRDPDTGDLEAWADDVLDDAPTYAEVSPSETGLRGFGLGFIPDGGNRGDIEDGAGHLEMYDSGRYLTVTGQRVDGSPDEVRQVNDEIADIHAEHIADPEPEREPPNPARDGGVRADSPTTNPTLDDRESGSTDLSDEDQQLLSDVLGDDGSGYLLDLWTGDWKQHTDRWEGGSSHSEADLALCSLLAKHTDDAEQIDRLFRASGLYREKWDRDDYAERTIKKALSGTTEYYEPPSDEDSPPIERVESDLVDALLDEPSAWIDADAKTWTVRDTEDHDADAIADAVRNGELPGDAWQALADAIMSGDVDLPDAVEDGLQAWRKDPDAWTVETSHEFDGTELSPDAVAADLKVPLSELGEERNGRIAYHVWERIRDGDHAKVIARTGVDGDDELLSYHSDVGVWRENGAEVLRTLARTALADTYSAGVKNELVEQVLATRDDGEPWGQKPIGRLGADPDTVPVANGTLDLTDGELRQRQPTEYVLAALPVEYDPDAECPTFETYLKEVCPRSVDRKKLQEYVGYTLMHWDLPFHKALFLAGPQASGKSTFLDTVNALLGGDPDDERGTTCSLSPQEMTDEKFAGYGLRKAWANIRSDIPNDLIENTGKFKELVAGDPVKVEKKYQDPITIRPTTKHLFAANTLPQADVDDDAFFRRILLVSFPNTVPRDERDPDLGDKLEAELSGILNWAIEGLNRLREQGHFTGAPTPAAIQRKWRAWGSSVDRFKERILETTNDPDDAVPKRDALDAYRRFCEAEGIPAKSERTFFDNLKQDADIGESRRRIDGSRKRVYTNVRLLTDRIDDVEDTEHDDSDQTGLF